MNQAGESSSWGDENLKYVLNLLKSGNENIQLPGRRNLVLVVGKEGSGKTIFTKFMIGNNKNLYATEVVEGAGDFFIIDSEAKSPPTGNLAWTENILPLLYLSEEDGTLYYDCPGFTENKSPAQDIAATYLVKKVIDDSRALKVVFLLDFTHLRPSSEREVIMKFLRDATSLMRDPDKYENSTVLVATKVDNQYIKGDEGYVLVPDTKMLESIVDYLREVKEDLIKQFSKLTPDMQSDRHFYLAAQKLLNIFTSNKNGTYNKIGLFRRPDEEGPISESEYLREAKPILYNLIHNDIEYVLRNENDFGYTVSLKTKVYIQDVADAINRNIASEVAKASQEVVERSIAMENSTEDISRKFSEYLESDFDGCYMTTLSSQDDSFSQSVRFIKTLLGEVGLWDATTKTDILVKIIDYDDYLNFLELVSSKNLKNPSEWAVGLTTLSYHNFASKKWYTFLVELNTWMSTYEIQLNKHKILIRHIIDDIDSKLSGEVVVKETLLKEFLDRIKTFNPSADVVKAYNTITDLKLDQTKVKSLKDVILSKLDRKALAYCDEGSRLIMKGEFVLLSDLHKVYKSCKNVNYVDIFANNKVFIDKDFSAVGDRIHLSIIAPDLEVIGKRKITLDGRNGVGLGKAKDGWFPGGAGEDGTPGEDGGPAGHFLMIGDTMSGGDLDVSLNGGAGAPGQHGGDGATGREGESPPLPGTPDIDGSVIVSPIWEELFFETDAKLEGAGWFSKWFLYQVHGKPGFPGGAGGSGGVGGRGGFKGTAKFVIFHPKSSVVVESYRGIEGRPGEGGYGGIGGTMGNSINLKCYNQYMLAIQAPKKCWILQTVREGRAETGRSGTRGGIPHSHPQEVLPLPNPSFTLNKYKYFLRDSINNTVESSSTFSFLKEIETRVQITKLHDTVGYVDDYVELENQFPILTRKINVLPFYQYFSDRIENYIKFPNERETKDDFKKVLAYMYTANLSKIFSQKNIYKKGLPKSLNVFYKSLKRTINELYNKNTQITMMEIVEFYRMGINEEIENLSENISAAEPEFNAVVDEVAENIKTLITFLKEHIDLENEDIRAKLKFEDELETLMRIKLILMPLNFIYEFAQFAVSVLEKANDIPQKFKNNFGILSVKNSYADLIQFTSTFYETVNDYIFRLNEVSTAERKLFKTQLFDTISFVEILKQNVTGLDETFEELVRSRHEFVALNTANAIIDPWSAIDRVREHLDTFLEEQKKPESPSGNTGCNLVLDFLQKLFSLRDITTEAYENIRTEYNHIDYFGDIARDVNKKMKDFKSFEKRIYRIILPKLNRIILDFRKALDEHQENLFYQFLNELGMEKVINEIKSEMSYLTKRNSLGEKLNRYFEKIYEDLSWYLQIQNRLIDLFEVEKLAAYVSDLRSPEAAKISVGNSQLIEALEVLDRGLKTNLLLEHYYRGVAVFVQSVFPFAHTFKEECFLPDTFTFDNTPSDLFDMVTEKLEDLNYMLRKPISIGNDYDKYIKRNAIFSSASNTTSFYTWENGPNKDGIGRLLRGLAVTLVADVTRGLEHDAVKFNEIGVLLKNVGDPPRQKMLEKTLVGLGATLTHHGRSTYRCGSSFYTIPSEVSTFKYPFPEDHKKESNYLDAELPVLSPYAMWTIQLTGAPNHFSKLHPFLNETIDLELIGRGMYLDKDIRQTDICGRHLETYYRSDSSTSDTVAIDKYFEEAYKGESNSYTISDRFVYSRVKRSKDVLFSLENANATRNLTTPGYIGNLVNSTLNIIRSHKPSGYFGPARPKITSPDLYEDDIMNDDFTISHGNILLWELFTGTTPKNKYPKKNDWSFESDGDLLAYGYYAIEKIANMKNCSTENTC